MTAHAGADFERDALAAPAAQEIADLASRILELAPRAGLHVGITIRPAGSEVSA
jgi:hypothetical protein